MKKGERRQRSQQLEIAKRAVDALQEKLRIILRNAKSCAALSNHLEGFYEEIDKLAKGKTLVPVTDLVVQEANDIVRDAKALITSDTYLDRVKEFVPAGDNPVYPDVLLSIRAVRQSLERAETHSDNRQQYLANLLREAPGRSGLRLNFSLNKMTSR